MSITTLISKSKIVKLDKSEADVLYDLYEKNDNNFCPAGMFCPDKKIWWVSSKENVEEHLSYTLCQKCYRNNNFGDKDESIKEELEPYIMDGVGCSCDGVTYQDAFPIDLGNGFKCGVYHIKPKMFLLSNIEHENHSNDVTIRTSEKCFAYGITICYKNITSDSENITLKPMMYDKDGNEEWMSIHPSVNQSQTVCQLDILGKFDKVTKKTYPLIFNSDNEHEKKRIVVTTMEGELLTEFTVTIKYEDDIEASEKVYKNIDDEYDVFDKKNMEIEI